MGLFDIKQIQEMITSPEIVEFDRQLAEMEQKKQEIIFKIGLQYVTDNTSETAKGTVYEKNMKEIEELAEKTLVLEKRKLAVQGLRKCEKCGNVLVLESAFCNKCGEKLEELFVASKSNSNICTKCGTAYAMDALFCTGCGSKLK